MSQPLRKAAAIGVLALAAASAAVAPANAATVPPKTLKYTCKYPLVDKQPLEVVVSSNIPDTVELNSLQPAFELKAKLLARGNTRQAITTLNAQWLEGTADLTGSVHFASGRTQEALDFGLTFDKWIRPAGPVPDPLELTAQGTTPSILFDELGKVDIKLDTFKIKLRAYRADGTEIWVKPLTTDFDNNPIPIDPNPGFAAVCKLDAGESNVIASPDVIELPVDTTPPSVPVGLTATAVTSSSVSLSWQPSTDPDPRDSVKGYNVYRDGVKIATVSSPSYVDTSVTGGKHVYSVDAFDQGDKQSSPSANLPVTVIVDEQPEVLEYALKGSTSLRTLTRGNLPLTGGIEATPDFAAGTFEADLTLNNTNGRLVAAGFLPITAKVGFVPIGKTTGTLDDATATTPPGITTNSKVRIKVLEVKLFGAIPLAGGNNCQTRSASDITLKSTNAFDPFKGGSIAGTYKISDLNGCGALNGIVSPLTAGGGNTITLDLTYRP